MLDFVKKAFRGGIEVLLWIILVVCAIAGGMIGGLAGGGGYAFSGIIVGIICGLLLDIIGGGFIVTILSIEKNVAEQTNLLKKQLGLDTAAETADAQVNSNTSNVPIAGLHTVKQGMKVYQERNDYNNVLEVLSTGDIVEFIEAGSTVNIAGKDAPMVKVKTKTGTIGWCFSGFLEKI